MKVDLLIMTRTKSKLPKLNSYELSKEFDSDENRSFSTADMDETTLMKIIIRGENIVHRALRPIVRIGNITVKYPNISLDEKSIVGYIDEIPPEGSEISLEYGAYSPGEEVADTDNTYPSGVNKAILPEKFTINKLSNK